MYIKSHNGEIYILVVTMAANMTQGYPTPQNVII